MQNHKTIIKKNTDRKTTIRTTLKHTEQKTKNKTITSISNNDKKPIKHKQNNTKL